MGRVGEIEEVDEKGGRGSWLEGGCRDLKVEIDLKKRKAPITSYRQFVSSSNVAGLVFL